jgi:hypothetical protein
VRHPRGIEHPVEQVHDGRLAVRPGDGRYPCGGSEHFEAEAHLGDYGYAALLGGAQHGISGPDTGADHDPVYTVKDFGPRAEGARDAELNERALQAFVVSCVRGEEIFAALKEGIGRRDPRFSEPVHQGPHGLT